MSKWTEQDAIGGYPSLELNHGRRIYEDAICLNSARNGFEYILRAKGYRRVHMPRYTCEAMSEYLLRSNRAACIYNIDLNLEPTHPVELLPDEAFLYTNYFGLKDDCVKRLHEIYGDRLIVDNAQALFSPPLPGVDTIYSPRKFFGVPDGGFLFTDKTLPGTFPEADSTKRFLHLIKRIESGAEAGYPDFKEAEKTLDNAPIQKMSHLTEALLESVDYARTAMTRRANYDILDNALKDLNKLHLPIGERAVPMVYPFLTDDPNLRKRLIDSRIFVATYWPNVKRWADPGSLEFKLADQLIPLPIDQRYGREEMKRIIQIVRG